MRSDVCEVSPWGPIPSPSSGARHRGRLLPTPYGPASPWLCDQLSLTRAPGTRHLDDEDNAVVANLRITRGGRVERTTDIVAAVG